MNRSPDTRASLLVRLQDSRDGRGWAEFIEIYTPLVYQLARRKGFQDVDAADLLGRRLAYVQHPTLNALPRVPGNRSSAASRVPRGAIVLSILALLLTGLGASEAAGVTRVSSLVATVLRIRFKAGTWVIETTNETLKLEVDRDGVAVSGSGINEVKVLSDGQTQLDPGKFLTAEHGDQRTTILSRESVSEPGGVVRLVLRVGSPCSFRWVLGVITRAEPLPISQRRPPV